MPCDLVPALVFLCLLAVRDPGLDWMQPSPPPPPHVLTLEAAGPESARLTWEEEPGLTYRLCVTWDRGRRQPYACFDIGGGNDTLAGVPRGDGEHHLLSLQACRAVGQSCSEPVAAGVVGRRADDNFDFYATALLQPDGRVSLTGYSRRPGATIAYHQGRPGRADQRQSSCPDLGEGGCGAAMFALSGSLAGVTQEIPGLGSASIIFELRDPPHAVLLFDDGNGLFSGSRLTVQTVLDEFGVKGTFFVIGRVMRDYPGVIRALVAAGHRVGNHTFSHPFLTQLTDAQIAQELDLTEQQFRAVIPGGSTKPCFRAPNGAIDRRVAAVVQTRGYRQVNWTVTSADWSGISAGRVTQNVLGGLHDGALISFHTQEPATIAALRTIIPVMQSWGYVFDLAC